ncbi:MAG TPA: type II toxin-antitoxin system prevent-host-death family antitoxin [Rhizomicrobium sp.]
MSSVGAREANRSFSRILKEAENGKSVTITRNGKPVARLVPAAVPPAATAMSKKRREKSLTKLMALLEKGYDLGGGPYSRDDMHER